MAINYHILKFQIIVSVLYLKIKMLLHNRFKVGAYLPIFIKNV